VLDDLTLFDNSVLGLLLLQQLGTEIELLLSLRDETRGSLLEFVDTTLQGFDVGVLLELTRNTTLTQESLQTLTEATQFLLLTDGVNLL